MSNKMLFWMGFLLLTLGEVGQLAYSHTGTGTGTGTEYAITPSQNT
jgi:hypothetical protein